MNRMLRNEGIIFTLGSIGIPYCGYAGGIWVFLVWKRSRILWAGRLSYTFQRDHSYDHYFIGSSDISFLYPQQECEKRIHCGKNTVSGITAFEG